MRRVLRLHQQFPTLCTIFEVMIPPIALGKSSKISLKQIPHLSSPTIYPKLPCTQLNITLLNGSRPKNKITSEFLILDMRIVLRVHQQFPTVPDCFVLFLLVLKSQDSSSVGFTTIQLRPFRGTHVAQWYRNEKLTLKILL